MREDFVTQLRLQLRDAAEREARRGPLGRAAQALRWDAVAPVALAATAAAVVAAFALVVLPFLQRDETVPAGHDLEIVANTPLVGQGGGMAAAFGAVWAADAGTGELLRIDPRSREIEARVNLGGESAFEAGAGAMWAVAEGRLLKIDPARAAVVGRLDLDLPARSLAAVLPGKGVMWLADAMELRRVDPDRMVIDRRIELARGSFLVRSGAFDSEHLYIQRSDGRLTTFDPATGARTASVVLTRPGRLVGAAAGGVLLESGDGIALVDPATGRTRWMKQLGTAQISGAAVAGTRIWVHGTDATSNRDRLWRLDARDGRGVGSVTLPDFGAAGGATVGDALWLMSPNGRLTVVAPS